MVPRDHEAGLLDLRSQRVVDLEAMPVALADLVDAVGGARPGARDQVHRLAAQAHGAAHVGDALLLGQQVDHREGRLLVELPGVGAGHAADRARELDHRALHAQADAQVGHAVLATVLDGLDLALDAAHAEAARHDHAVGAAEALGHGVGGELLGVDPEDAQLAAVVDGRVLEGLPDRQVGLVELHVLADEGDRDRLVAGVDALDQRRATPSRSGSPPERPSLRTTSSSRSSSCMRSGTL